MSESDAGHQDFTTRVWLALGPVVFVVVCLLFFWKALNVVLLIFGAVLLGLFIHGLAEVGAEHAPGSNRAWVVGVSLALPLVLVLLAWLLGPRVVEQFSRLAEELPNSLQSLESRLRQTSWGGELLALMPAGEGQQGGGWGIVGRVTGIFSTTLGVLANVFIVAFLGFYFAVSPTSYERAMVRLLPARWRERATEVLETLGSALRSWLLGRLASMAVISALTAIGLVLLGVPLVLSLALLAGLLGFVPYIGPVVAAAPAVLLAWGQGIQMAVWVALFYWGVQIVESFLVTPFIQKSVVSIPPALLITSQIVMGVAAGLVGVLLATPLAVAAVVLVQTLYVEEVLGDEVDVWGS